MIDWGGAQRWINTDISAEEVRYNLATTAHATAFRGYAKSNRFQPLSPAMRKIHQQIKSAFDPHGIFNPNKMYKDW